MFAANPFNLSQAFAGEPPLAFSFRPPPKPLTVSLAAGLLSAGLLGAGLAAWVRPQAAPPAPPPVVQPSQPPRGLQIIVEAPAPSTPLEVMPELSGGPAMGSETAVRADRPSFDCRKAATLAEQMICVDPGLARSDRRLDAAYRKARALQADPAELGRAQAAWLAAREQAALASPEALASAYETRIRVLETLAGQDAEP